MPLLLLTVASSLAAVFSLPPAGTLHASLRDPLMHRRHAAAAVRMNLETVSCDTDSESCNDGSVPPPRPASPSLTAPGEEFKKAVYTKKRKPRVESPRPTGSSHFTTRYGLDLCESTRRWAGRRPSQSHRRRCGGPGGRRASAVGSARPARYLGIFTRFWLLLLLLTSCLLASNKPVNKPAAKPSNAGCTINKLRCSHEAICNRNSHKPARRRT